MPNPTPRHLREEEDPRSWCHRALKDAVQADWRHDEDVFRQIGSLLSECLARPDPIWYFPLHGVTPATLRGLLTLAAEQPSQTWLTAAVEVETWLAELAGLVRTAHFRLPNEWSDTDLNVFDALCWTVIERYPDLANAVEEYAAAGDLRRFSWFVEPGAPQHDDFRGGRFEDLVTLIFRDNPHEVALWKALLRMSPRPAILELAVDRILPAVLEAVPAPEQGVVAGSPAEGPLREVLGSGLISPDDLGWRFVRKGLNASGAATRGQAAAVLAEWDRSKWPSDAATSVAKALERETDRAVRIRLEKLAQV